MPSSTSPWKNTGYTSNGTALGYFQIRPVPASN